MSIKNIIKVISQNYINYKLKTPNSCLIHRSVVAKKLICEGYNSINSGTHIYDSKVGYATFIGMNCNIYNTTIGKYSSIGNDVKIIIGRHPTRGFVSSHPAFYSKQPFRLLQYSKEQKFVEYKYIDVLKKRSVIIENDVWIGSDVLILEGVRIGNGAIVGAGSVVVSDIAPYSIVAGNPSKVIRMKYDTDTIEKLCAFEWWNKGEEWIRKNAEMFDNMDVFKTYIE